MRVFFVPSLMIVALVAAVQAGCLVHSRCVSDSECPGAERCNAESGECELECSDEAPDRCSGARPVCLEEEFRCIECLLVEDCDEGEQCLENECAPEAAPAFALVDQNESSPTYGQTLTLEDYRGEVVLLFFAGLS